MVVNDMERPEKWSNNNTIVLVIKKKKKIHKAHSLCHSYTVLTYFVLLVGRSDFRPSLCFILKSHSISIVLPGYGNVTPRTLLGKLATILYAIVGMPLFLLYLSNIGDILAKSFKWIYAKCCLCRGCKKRRKRMLAVQRKEQWKVKKKTIAIKVGKTKKNHIYCASPPFVVSF